MEPTHSGVFVALVSFFLAIAIVYIYLAIKWSMRPPEEPYVRIKPYTNKYTVYDHLNKSKKEEPAAVEPKKHHRERPPNATFFGRIDGKEIKIEGEYEEKFLNGLEILRWKLKKKRRELKELRERER